MELYVCGFNAHNQLLLDSDHEILQFTKILRAPQLAVQCMLWSSTVIENDGDLFHRGFRPVGIGSVALEGPPSRNIKTFFGDTSGVLGALAKDGGLYVMQNDPDTDHDLKLKRHHFKEQSFIHSQHLAIDHLAIADNGEVCVITSGLCTSICFLAFDLY